MHETGLFSIPAIRDFVPERCKPWIIIFIVIVFQLSGGVYMAAAGEMVGSLALMQEDIMMAGYASMAGMALTFTVMFRLKFQFTTKVAFMTCGTVLVLCNLICMHTDSVPLLVAVSFISGFFRMWATFECNSTIQLWLTPKRDLSIFFCYIYLLVNSCIQLSGLATIYVSHFSTWEYMHWFIIGMLCFVMLLVMLIFRNIRVLRRLPLYGIDWVGALLWGLILLCIVFVCLYGDHYDWFESVHICTATLAGLLMLLLNIWRASFIRHPFIALDTFRYRMVWLSFLLYIVVDFLLSPSHLLEHIYLEGVLGYDSLHTVSLNWVVLLGIITGAFFTWQTFALHKWSYKVMTVIAFCAITGYLAMFYFTIDYNLPKSALVLPIFLRGFGYVIIAICFITALSRVPFENFFQAVSVQAFVSATFGGVLGAAVLTEILKLTVKHNAMLLGAGLDHVNPLAARLPVGQLYGAVQQQALMVSMKEIYGWLTLLGLFCLLMFLVNESKVRPQNVIHPTYKAIRKLMKRETIS